MKSILLAKQDDPLILIKDGVIYKKVNSLYIKLELLDV